MRRDGYLQSREGEYEDRQQPVNTEGIVMGLVPQDQASRPPCSADSVARDLARDVEVVPPILEPERMFPKVAGEDHPNWQDRPPPDYVQETMDLQYVFSFQHSTSNLERHRLHVSSLDGSSMEL